jgi:hypothetical protein
MFHPTEKIALRYCLGEEEGRIALYFLCNISNTLAVNLCYDIDRAGFLELRRASREVG